jgi:hypothetical protein
MLHAIKPVLVSDLNPFLKTFLVLVYTVDSASVFLLQSRHLNVLTYFFSVSLYSATEHDV